MILVLDWNAVSLGAWLSRQLREASKITLASVKKQEPPETSQCEFWLLETKVQGDGWLSRRTLVALSEDPSSTLFCPHSQTPYPQAQTHTHMHIT